MTQYPYGEDDDGTVAYGSYLMLPHSHKVYEEKAAIPITAIPAIPAIPLDDINYLVPPDSKAVSIALGIFFGIFPLLAVFLTSMSLKCRPSGVDGALRPVCRRSTSKCQCCFRRPRSYADHLRRKTEATKEEPEQSERLSTITANNSSVCKDLKAEENDSPLTTEEKIDQTMAL